MEFDFSLTEALNGLEEAFWPARCQVLPNEIIVDGAHNADGIKTLLESLHEFAPYQKVPIIFGGFKDKNIFRDSRRQPVFAAFPGTGL